MMVYFILLTSGAGSNEDVDKRGEAWPPEVTFNNSFGAKVPYMPCDR